MRPGARDIRRRTARFRYASAAGDAPRIEAPPPYAIGSRHMPAPAGRREGKTPSRRSTQQRPFFATRQFIAGVRQRVDAHAPAALAADGVRRLPQQRFAALLWEVAIAAKNEEVIV